MDALITDFPQWLKMFLVAVPLMSLLVATCVFGLNLRQTILTNKISRAKMISDTLHTFMDDEIVQKAFYKIEYEGFKYSPSFHGSEEEKEIDKLLRHFSNLALMWKNGLLSLEDIYPIQYYVMRIVQNEEINKYFDFMRAWIRKPGISSHPFLILSELGKEIEKDNAKKDKKKRAKIKN